MIEKIRIKLHCMYYKIEDVFIFREYRRWERLHDAYCEMDCPMTHEEYEEIHRMFVKVMLRSTCWRESFYYLSVDRDFPKDIKALWPEFLGRLNYSTDRMGWRNLIILTRYLDCIEKAINKRERE